jgi:hypothetical protein
MMLVNMYILHRAAIFLLATAGYLVSASPTKPRRWSRNLKILQSAKLPVHHACSMTFSALKELQAKLSFA